MPTQLISVDTALKNQRIALLGQYSTLLTAICVGFKSLNINITLEDVQTTLKDVVYVQASNIMLQSVGAIVQQPNEENKINATLDKFVRTKLVEANAEDFKFGDLALNAEMVSQMIALPDISDIQDYLIKLNSIDISPISYFLHELLSITAGVCIIDEDAEDTITTRSSYFTSTIEGIARYTKTKAIMDALNDARASHIDVGTLASGFTDKRAQIPGILFNGTQFVLDGGFLSGF